MAAPATFHFRQFSIRHQHSMRVGTDSVLLGAWANLHSAARVLDVGTGSGILALMVAQRTDDDTRIEAIEIDPTAAAEAQVNFEQSRWRDRLQLIAGEFPQAAPSGPYDVIISNPPYFENSLLPPASNRGRTRHTITLHPAEILAFAAERLTALGRVNLVLPVTTSEALIGRMGGLPLRVTRVCQVQSRAEKPVERLLLEFSRQQSTCEQTRLVLHAGGNTRSDAYAALTQAFYTKD